MTSKEIIEIGKKVLLFAGVFSEISPKEAKSYIQSLEKYKEILGKEDSQYAGIILGYIDDVLDDINNSREINIDSIMEDEYIENYINTSVLAMKYKKIFTKQDSLDIQKILRDTAISQSSLNSLKKIQKNIEATLNDIDPQKFSQYLLLLQTHNFPKFESHFLFLSNSALNMGKIEYAQILDEIRYLFKDFKYKIRQEGYKHISEETFEHKMLIVSISQNKISRQAQDLGAKNPRLAFMSVLQRI